MLWLLTVNAFKAKQETIAARSQYLKIHPQLEKGCHQQQRTGATATLVRDSSRNKNNNNIYNSSGNNNKKDESWERSPDAGNKTPCPSSPDLAFQVAIPVTNAVDPYDF
jgi:hypothetical protein